MLCGLKGASGLASGGVNQGLGKPSGHACLTARVSSDTFRMLEKMFEISIPKSSLAKEIKAENKLNDKVSDKQTTKPAKK